MEHLPRGRRLLLLLLPLLAVSWPAAAAASSDFCYDGDQHTAHPGCVDAAGLARRHGDVWRERAGRHADGGCVRRVSACVAGRLLRPVPDRVERCPRAAAANRACRMESFFACCPVYDCPSKLASLIAPLSPGQDPRGSVVETFLSRVQAPQLLQAAALPLPVARPQLNATAIRQLLDWLEARPSAPSAAERSVRAELRHILAVLQTAGGAAPPEPAEARGALRLLRALTQERRRTAAHLLRLLLAELDAGRLRRPLTAQQLMRSLMTLGVTESAADVAAVTTALFRLQIDSRDTSIEELLRYIVLYGGLDDETDTEPDPDSRTTTEEKCSEEQDGLVWAEMEVPVDGRCERRVRACRDGRVVSTAQLQSRQHVCDATGPELCRVHSFFTCCPVFDCAEKLEELRAQDPRFLSADSLSPEQFLRRVSPADLASVHSPVPIVDRSLHWDTFRDMANLMGNSTEQERRLREELDQIVGLFEKSDSPAPEVQDGLRRLAATLDDIGLSVSLYGTAVRPATALQLLLAGQHLRELRDALAAGVLAESVVPAELPGAAARLLLSLGAAEPAVPLSSELHQLVLTVAGGGSAAGPDLTALLAELERVLDAWLALLPDEAFPPLPLPGPLGPPDSFHGLLWWLLTAEDGTQPAPLLPGAGNAAPTDSPLLEALLRLVRHAGGGAPSGRLRAALLRLVRHLSQPGGDSQDTVQILLEVVERLASGPSGGLEPAALQAALDLLVRLGGHQQPAPHVIQLLLRLVEGLTPRHRVVGEDTRALLVELLRRLGGRPDALGSADVQLLVTAVRQLGEVTRRDIRPDLLAQLVTLLGRLGGSPGAADSGALSVLVRLVGSLGDAQPHAENTAVLRLLLQMLETLAAAPDSAQPDTIQLVVRLVEQLGRPGADAADAAVVQQLLQLISGLRRPPAQLGSQLVQLVLQLGRQHGPSAPALRPLLLAILPLLSAQTPRAASGDGLLQILLTMVEDVPAGRTAGGGSSELHRLLLQLTQELSARRRPLPADARRLLLELFVGTQSGGVTEADVMQLVLAMLELLERPDDTPTATIGFNITTVQEDGPGQDVQGLRQLIELLFSQGWLDGRSAGAGDITSVITVLLGGDEGGSDTGDTEQLMSLLLGLLETELRTPPQTGGLNVTAILTDGGGPRQDLSGVLRTLEMLLARLGDRPPQRTGYLNITGVMMEEAEREDLGEMQDLIEMLLARMSMQKPRESGIINITLVNEQPPPDQYDEVRGLLEMLLVEIESLELGRAPTGGLLNISTVLVTEEGGRRDFTELREMLALLMAQLTARTTAPRSPGLINISLVQQPERGGGELHSARYLLELLMSQLRRQADTHSSQGFLNISGVLLRPGRDDFGDVQGLLELLLEQLSASQTPDFPGFLNISGILVNGEQTEMKSLRAMLEMLMARMSTGQGLPSEQLASFRELVMRFFGRPGGPQDIDVQGIINMLIDLSERDTAAPAFSVSEFVALLESLDVPAGHPTFSEDIRRLMVLLRGGHRAPAFLTELTEVVMRLLRLVETAGGSNTVTPETLIRFIVRQSARPAGGGETDVLLAALARLLDGGAAPRRPDFTVGVLVPPPDSLPAALRDLVVRLQVAARRPRPLLDSLPPLLQLLTGLMDRAAPPDVLQFAARLAGAVLERAPDAADRVLVPQILLQLRQLTRYPRPDRLTSVTGLLRRLLLLEQQRRPTHSTGGGDISVTVTMGGTNSSSSDSSTDVMTLLQGLLEGRAGGGGGSPLPELTQTLLDVLLRAERDGGVAPLADLLPQLVSVLRLAIQPPADAAPPADDTLLYVWELTRAVLERLEPRAEPLLPHVLLLLRRLGPRPQPSQLRGVLAVLEQLLARHEAGAADGGGVPGDVLELLVRVEEASERGRPADYLTPLVALLRRAQSRPHPALTVYLSELTRDLLTRDAQHLDPRVASRVLALISGDSPVDLGRLLGELELVVKLPPGRGHGRPGFGGLADLFGLLPGAGRSAAGGDQLDFSAWLMHLMDEDRPQHGAEASERLLSHLIHLLRRREVRLVSPDEASRLLLLLTGRLDDPSAVSVSTLHAVLQLLELGYVPRPTDTADELLRQLRRRLWGVLGRPDSRDPAAAYRHLLTALTGRQAELPASEDALHRALLLLLAGPSATADPDGETARLLLTLLVGPGDSITPRLVPASVLGVLDALLQAASAGGRTPDAPESALIHLVRLLTEPEWRGRTPAPEPLLQLLVSAVTGATGDSHGRHDGARHVALRLLLRLLSDSDAHRMIPIPEEALLTLLAPPDGRAAGDGSDADSLFALTGLFSDPGMAEVMMTLFGDHDEHPDPPDHGGQHGSGSAPRPLYQWLLARLGEDEFDPDQVPASVYAELTALLSSDQFNPAAADGQTRRLLLALGGDQLPADRLLHRLLLLLARRGGLPDSALAPPGRLLHRCRMLCSGAAAAAGTHAGGGDIQLLPGRTPITFIGDNRVIVLNA